MKNKNTPPKMVNKRNLAGIRPTNIRTMLTKKRIAAVEKFAGTIRMHTVPTAIIMGTYASLKIVSLSCFIESTLAINIINAIFAKSDG
jgi:hypothetical protein